MKVNVSRAVAGDATAIFQMASELATSFDVHGEHSNDDLSDLLDNPSNLLFVAKIDEQVVGYTYGNIHYAFYAAKKNRLD